MRSSVQRCWCVAFSIRTQGHGNLYFEGHLWRRVCFGHLELIKEDSSVTSRCWCWMGTPNPEVCSRGATHTSDAATAAAAAAVALRRHRDRVFITFQFWRVQSSIWLPMVPRRNMSAGKMGTLPAERAEPRDLRASIKNTRWKMLRKGERESREEGKDKALGIKVLGVQAI